MSKNNTCEKCVHCCADMQSKQIVYKCLRYPPVPAAIPVQGQMGQVGVQVMSISPQIKLGDTCGEFVEVLPKIKLIN